jgi:uncharacterized membrane protein
MSKEKLYPQSGKKMIIIMAVATIIFALIAIFCLSVYN